MYDTDCRVLFFHWIFTWGNSCGRANQDLCCWVNMCIYLKQLSNNTHDHTPMYTHNLTQYTNIPHTNISEAFCNECLSLLLNSYHYGSLSDQTCRSVWNCVCFLPVVPFIFILFVFGRERFWGKSCYNQKKEWLVQSWFFLISLRALLTLKNVAMICSNEQTRDTNIVWIGDYAT